MRLVSPIAALTAISLLAGGFLLKSSVSQAADPLSTDDNDIVVADTATEFFEGIPDRDSHSGVFLDVISTGSDSIRSTLNPSLFRITFGKDVANPKIFIWDGNNAGRWDQNGLSTDFPLVARPPLKDIVTDFDVTTDGTGAALPVRHGESEITYGSPPPTPQTADVIFLNSNDARWEILFDGPHSPGALLPTGEHRYLLKVQFRSDQLTAINAFKVAANGSVEIIAGTPPPGAPPETPQVLGGFIGGVVDGLSLDNVPTVTGDFSVARDPYPELLTPNPALQLATSIEPHFVNRFDGTIDIRVRLVPPPGQPFDEYLHKIVLTNADLDDRDDLTELDANGVVEPHTPSPGLPADQGGPYTAPRNPAPGQGFSRFNTSGFALPQVPDPSSPSPNGDPYLEIYPPDAPPPASPVRVYTDLSGTIPSSGLGGYERMPIPADGKPGIWLLRFKQTDARNSIFVRSDAVIVAKEARVEGRVYCDADQDGNDDGGEDHGIPGVDVRVTRTDIVGGSVFHATSDADGVWKVEPVPAGTYRVEVDTGSLPLVHRSPTSPTALDIALAADEKRFGVNFGFTCGIGGRVYCDANSNGIDEQPDEHGIGSVEVTLTPVGGGAALHRTTDEHGNWDVESMVPGTYDVSVDPAAPPLAGTPPTTLSTLRVTLTTSASPPPVSFGFLCSSRLTGRVYCDADQDGTDDGGTDAGLPGVQVVATKLGLPNGPVFKATTDATGAWDSGLVPAGSYDVTVDPKQPALATKKPIHPDPMEISTSVATGETKPHLDFGVGLVGTAALSGRVYCDADQDGTDGNGTDVGIPGVQVVVVFSGIVGGPTYTVTTDATGAWKILGLAAGSVDITVDPAQAPLAGKHAVSPAPPSRTTTTADGATRDHQDFGFGLNGTVTLMGRVYCDADQDGTDDGGTDVGLPGVVVTATPVGIPGAPPLVFDVTGTNGEWKIVGLPAGTWQVVVGPGQAPLAEKKPIFPNPPTRVVPTVPGQTVPNLDFGYGLLGTSSIAGRVYCDADQDGTDNAGADAGIDGVKVVATLAGGATYSTSTGPDGAWKIVGVPPGAYTVELPLGQPALAGKKPVNPSPSTQATTVAAGESRTGVDFGVGLVGTTSLSGRVYCDADKDGTDDGGTDVGIPGVTVVATPAGIPGALVVSVVTEAGGAWKIVGLPAGTWLITIDGSQSSLVGKTPVNPNPASRVVLLGDGESGTGVNFGYGLDGAQSLSGRVYCDADKDGTDDGGLDLGLGGVTVVATRTDIPGGPSFSTVTGADGSWQILGIPAGTYAISVSPAQPPLSGKSAVNPNPPQRTTPVGLGQHVGSQDFGFGVALGNSTLSGRVYDDLDRDGTDDGGTDPGIPGAIVRVTRTDIPGGPVFLVPTGPDGSWTLAGLPPGTYDVFVDPTQPADSGRTPVNPATADRTVPLAGGATVSHLDFGFGESGTASLAGRVYCDADGDGTDDLGFDAGIPGVLVSATRTDIPGGPTFTTTTGPTGAWQILGVPAGSYTVLLPPGQPALAGKAPVNPNPSSRPTTVAAGEARTGLDFGLGATGTGSLAGRVYVDRNLDGSDDGNTDPGIGGVPVRVRMSGVPGGPTFVTATGPDGAWQVAGLPPGTYEIVVDPLDPSLTGRVPVFPIPPNRTVAVSDAEHVVDQDFGFKSLGVTSLSGRVYCDADKDGTDDGGSDAGIEGVKVVATLTGGGVFTAYTDSTGAWSIPGVPAGVYTIVVDPLQESLAGKTPIHPNPPVEVATVDAPASGIDFGFGLTGTQSLSGRVYCDADRDGTDDAGADAGIGGLEVVAALAGGSTFTTTTDPTGAWQMLGIPAGTYSITVSPAQPPLLNKSPVNPNPPQRATPVGPGQHVGSQDFGFGAAPGDSTLSGRVYDDLDKDGTDDGGTDPGVPGAVVRITRTDIPGGPVFLVPTGPDGSWSLAGLPPGTYDVFVDPAQPAVLGRTPVNPPLADRTVPLAPGQVVTGLDFGFGRNGTASLAGRVYCDADKDGTDDAGADAGISGVEVVAVLAGGATFTTTTGPTGVWQIVGLPAGAYSIVLTPGQPALVGKTPVNPNPAVLLTSVLAGQARTGLNFGLGATGTGSLGGRVFADLDSDGTDEGGGDPGIGGALVKVTRIDGPGGPTFVTTTNADGSWTALGLPPGTYLIEVDPSQPALGGLAPTAPNPPSRVATIAAPGEDVRGQNFGFGQHGTSSLAGRVYCDADQDGTDDGGTDVGIPGITVVATPVGIPGALVVSAVTNAGGAWKIVGLPAGTWLVTIEPGQPGLEGKTSVNPSPASRVVQLGDGESGTGVDFGYGLNGAQSLAGRVYCDADKDGTDDGGLDLGLGGVTVVATRTDIPGGPAFSTVTGADGSWQILGIPPGTYSIVVSPAQAPLASKSAVNPNPPQRTTPVSAGRHVGSQDFGFGVALGNSTLSGRVYDDRDRDGTDDGGTDPGIPGAIVRVTRTDIPGGPVFLVPTGPDGSWSLAGLPPGTYDVFVDPAQPAVLGRTPVNPATADRTVPLTSGATVSHLDYGFGSSGTASLAGRVYCDADRDGTDDAGFDAGIPGVLVAATRTDVPGGPTFTTTTGPTGAWQIIGVPAGSFAVTLDPSQPALAGKAPVNPNPSTRFATVALGDRRTGIDFGLGATGTGSLAGRVYVDPNLDGTDNGNTDPGIGGVLVLVHRTGAPGGPTFVTMTGLNGSWQVTGLPPGTYEIVVNPGDPVLAGRPPVFPNPPNRTVALSDGEHVLDQDFGFHSLGATSLSGRVYCDADQDGTDDGGSDAGIAGVKVVASLTGGGVFTTYTDATGAWSIPNAPTGTYTIVVDPAQAPLAGKTPIHPNPPVEVATVDAPASGINFGFAAPETACTCTTDSLKKVCLSTELWVGAPHGSIEVGVELRAGCGGKGDEKGRKSSAALEDRLTFTYCGRFSGPLHGANGVIEVTGVTVECGVMTVRFCLTAVTGKMFPNGIFEGDQFVAVSTSGCDRQSGCAHFTCANAKAGGEWPPCAAKEKCCEAPFTVTATEFGSCASTPPVKPPCTPRGKDWWKARHKYAKTPALCAPWPDACNEDGEIAGRSWICLLETSPRGDAWLTLAHEWIAASLNRCAGARPPPDVEKAIAEAGSCLDEDSGKDSHSSHKGKRYGRMGDLADTLRSWNEGGDAERRCGSDALAAKDR